jgi:CheY-like chemotaxis protein
MLLPEIGGEEILRAMKGDPRTEQIPVIIVSHLPPTEIAALKAAGAADYFHKSRFLDDRDGETAFLKIIAGVIHEAASRKEASTSLALVARTR